MVRQRRVCGGVGKGSSHDCYAFRNGFVRHVTDQKLHLGLLALSYPPPPQNGIDSGVDSSLTSMGTLEDHQDPRRSHRPSHPTLSLPNDDISGNLPRWQYFLYFGAVLLSNNWSSFTSPRP